MATHSDILLCDPCQTSHASKPAIQYCLDCDELLCEICADCHMRFKSTKGHKLVSCEEKYRYEGARLLSKSLMCPRHSEKPIEVRCEDHKELCCLTCASIVHRKCNTILEVKNLGRSLKSKNETKSLHKHIINTKACIEEILRRNDNAYKVLESSVDEVPKILQGIQTSLAKLYEALEKDIMKKVAEYRVEVCETTIARKEVWDSNLLDTEGLSKMLDTVLNIGSESQTYIAYETIMAKLEKMKEQIELIDKSGEIKEQVLHLELKNELKNFLKPKHILSCVDLKLNEGVWCNYPKVSRFLTEDISANEANMTSDFLCEELDSSRVSGRNAKQSVEKDAMHDAIRDSDHDSDTDSINYFKQNTKCERKTNERYNKREKTKMKYARNYRH